VDEAAGGFHPADQADSLATATACVPLPSPPWPANI